MRLLRLISGVAGCGGGGARRELAATSCCQQPVRTYWWGHETIEEQEEQRRKKRDKDIIEWSNPEKMVKEKQEYIWVPNRIKSEAQIAKNLEDTQVAKKVSSFTSTTDLLSFTTKYSPSFWKFLFHPEQSLEDTRKNDYSRLVKSQEFVQERLLALGPDLAAAHFLCHSNCRVRFRGHKEWTELDSNGNLNIPAIFVPGWYIEAIDCSTSRIVYEGLQNLRNLHYLKYLDCSYCPNIDEWCIDRISGEFADTLEYINLSGCRNLDGNGLEVLWRFRNLKTLVLKDMDHVADLPLICLLLLDVMPKLKIIGAEYMDTKLLEGTEHSHLLEDDFIPKIESGESTELSVETSVNSGSVPPPLRSTVAAVS